MECDHTNYTYDLRAKTDKCITCKKYLRRAFFQKACPTCKTWVSRFVAEQRIKKQINKVTCWHCGTDVTGAEMREQPEKWITIPSK